MRQMTVGELLQEERLKHSLSLQELSKKTRIRVEYLEALEANEFRKLPAATFVKGYIKMYATLFDFDYESLIGLLRRDFKESAKGTLIPQDFLTPVLKKRKHITPVTLTVVGLFLSFITILGYIGFQWYQLRLPPEISITEPEEFATVGPQIQVTGSTELDAVLMIDNQPVALQPDGTFTREVSFVKEGITTITIEAKDPRGKTTLEERHVQVQF